MSPRQSTILLISLSILSVTTIMGQVHPARGQASTPGIFLSPATMPLQPPNTLVTFYVNVSNIPDTQPLGTWDIIVSVGDPTILKPVSINLIENFGNTASILSDCINGVGQGCGISDTTGAAHSAVQSFFGPFPIGNDTLFSITFNSLASDGYTSISISQNQQTLSPLLGDSGGNPIQTSPPVGAVYGNAASAPVAIFTWSPISPFQYEAVTVNASLSYAQPGATITSYLWGSKTTAQNVTTLIFKTPGNQSITLVVKDSKSRLSIPVTHFLVVRQKITVDLNLQVLSLSQYNYIVPGTQVQITAQIFNNGTTTVNAFNVTIRLENQVIAVIQNINNITLNQYANLKYTWDTTGVKPSSYTLSATLTNLPGDNNTQDKFLSVDIRIIEPLGSSLVGLSLVQFGGLTVIVIIAAAFGFYSFAQRSARKRRAKEEAL